MARCWSRGQKGFTLIEVLVAISAASILAGVFTSATYEVLNVSAITTSRLLALKQVQNAVHWVSRDAQMAQTVTPTGASGLPVTLTWVEWNGASDQVVYRLQGSTLHRVHSLNGAPDPDQVIAEEIDSGADQTSCQYADGVLTFSVTATVDGRRPATESDVVRVMSRCAS